MSPERILRHDDERLYQPKIHSRHIRALHRLSLETGEPMTVLVDRALEGFAERYRSHPSAGKDLPESARGEDGDPRPVP